MKRNCRFEVRLSKSEFEGLSKKAKKAGLSAGAFVRKAIAGTEVREAPDADVGRLIMEMRRVGANVNQTLKNMNGSGVLDLPKFRQDMNELRAATKLVVDTYAPEET